MSKKNFYNRSIKEELKKYKHIKADIIDIEIRLEELEEEIIGIKSSPVNERVSETYKTSSNTEIQAETYIIKRASLLKELESKKRWIKKIDNSLSRLNDREADIIRTAIIEGKRYAVLEIKYDRTYCRIKQIEREALNKIEKYVL